MTTKHYCGLDFHKNFTQICVLDAEGKVVEENRIKTEILYTYLSNKNYVIALEASGGTFDAASKLEAYGHQVVLVNPSQFKAIGLNGKKSKSSAWQAISGRICRFHCEVFTWSKNRSLFMDRMNNISEVVSRIHFINLARLN